MKKKTHKGTAKRYKVTKTGKLMHSKAGRSHLRVKKGPSLFIDKSGKVTHPSDYKKVKALLPYTA